MKAAPLAAILVLALAASGAIAQSPAPNSPVPPAATPGEPQILNAPKPAQKPAAAVEPYAGQKPPGEAQPTTTAAPVPSPTAPAATAPAAAEGAATAAKAAASEAKSAPTVPEGPAVKPIDKNAAPASAAAKSDTRPDAKSDAKSDAVPTLAKPEPPKPTLHVAIDLTGQRMTVTENGGSSYKWTISSGRTGYLTPKGTFRPVWMSKMWYSRKYDYAPMPHAIFFHGGAAIHGTDSVYALGRPASHGCVRLSPSNAARSIASSPSTASRRPRSPSSARPSSRDRSHRTRKACAVRARRCATTKTSPGGTTTMTTCRRFQAVASYSDREYDDGYDRPSRYRPMPRQRRYVRDYDPYGSDF